MAKAGAKSSATRQAAGDETRARIVDAALETLKTEGIMGASARAIARTGGFNQALIFYHFGSINDLLLAAMDVLSAKRLGRYEERINEINTLPELLVVARSLHEEDMAEGHLAVLVQLVAGSFAMPELGAGVWKRFEPWLDITERAIRRVTTGTPFEQFVPVADLAYAVTAEFLGLELLGHVEGDRTRERAVFSTLDLLAGLANGLIASGMLGPLASALTPPAPGG